MPVLRGRVHGQDRDDFRAVACQAAQMDSHHVSCRDGEERHFVLATRQGNWRNSKDFMAYVCNVSERHAVIKSKNLSGTVEIDEAYIGGKESKLAWGHETQDRSWNSL